METIPRNLDLQEVNRGPRLGRECWNAVGSPGFRFAHRRRSARPCAAGDGGRLRPGGLSGHRGLYGLAQRSGPKRGEIVRQIGQHLRAAKKDLAALIALENGKILAEAEGEVQEMIDNLRLCRRPIADALRSHDAQRTATTPALRAVAPLGPIGVITAFNFPTAVWAWNAMIGLVAGDTVVWKPSSRTPLTALATARVAGRVLKENDLPEGILNVVVGGRSGVGEALIADRRLPLVSATGSVAMGRRVGQAVTSRLGRPCSSLEATTPSS